MVAAAARVLGVPERPFRPSSPAPTLASGLQGTWREAGRAVGLPAVPGRASPPSSVCYRRRWTAASTPMLRASPPTSG